MFLAWVSSRVTKVCVLEDQSTMLSLKTLPIDNTITFLLYRAEPLHDPKDIFFEKWLPYLCPYFTHIYSKAGKSFPQGNNASHTLLATNASHFSQQREISIPHVLIWGFCCDVSKI